MMSSFILYDACIRFLTWSGIVVHLGYEEDRTGIVTDLHLNPDVKLTKFGETVFERIKKTMDNAIPKKIIGLLG